MTKRPYGLPSVRDRLTRALVVLWAVTGIAVAVAVWATVQSEADEVLDGTLSASATVLSELLVRHRGELLRAAQAGNGAAPQAIPLGDDSHFAWQLVDGNGSVRLRSTRAPPEALTLPLQTGFRDAAGWRILGVKLAPAEMLYVAESRAERQEAITDIAASGAAVALGIAALGLVWLRWQLRRELAPLEALTAEVARFDPLQPNAALGPPVRAEFVPLLGAIDTLGRGLAQRVANERAVSAHAAHALRTPLAGIDAQLAVAMRECPAELRPRLARTREAAARLQRVVAALLTLFRAGGEMSRRDLDVGELLATMPIDALVVDVAAHSSVNADPDLLAAALANLLDNARRHGADRVAVSVEGHVLRLLDDGPGVPPAKRLALQQAIDGQEAAAPMGLGLLLADRVARAHGGRLHLVPGDQGFGIELILPPPAGR